MSFLSFEQKLDTVKFDLIKIVILKETKNIYIYIYLALPNMWGRKSVGFWGLIKHLIYSVTLLLVIMNWTAIIQTIILVCIYISRIDRNVIITY